MLFRKTLLNKSLKASFLHSKFLIIPFDPAFDLNKDITLGIERIKFVGLSLVFEISVHLPKSTTFRRWMVVSNLIS